MKIEPGFVVRIEYELKVKGGDVLESSDKTGPLEYVHGEPKLLPALTKLLAGMGVGERKAGVIPASEAFGAPDAHPVTEIPRGEFPKGVEVTKGAAFEARGPNGAPVTFEVVDVEKDRVRVRLAHPLADKDLEYRVRVLSIEDKANNKRVAVPPPPPPARALGIDVDVVEE